MSAASRVRIAARTPYSHKDEISASVAQGLRNGSVKERSACSEPFSTFRGAEDPLNSVYADYYYMLLHSIFLSVLLPLLKNILVHFRAHLLSRS